MKLVVVHGKDSGDPLTPIFHGYEIEGSAGDASDGLGKPLAKINVL